MASATDRSTTNPISEFQNPIRVQGRLSRNIPRKTIEGADQPRVDMM